jgi:hypothetical protein
LATSRRSVRRINAEDPDFVLAIRVEVGLVMGRARFRKHANDNPKEPAELRHKLILHRSAFAALVAPPLV